MEANIRKLYVTLLRPIRQNEQFLGGKIYVCNSYMDCCAKEISSSQDLELY